jgi:uncharacterized protein YwqG
MVEPVLLSRRVRKVDAPWFDARSWFGGLPRLGGQSWPRNAKHGRPLYHLAQIDLVAASRHAGGALLPGEGWLSFFHDDFDDDGGAVVFVPGVDLPATTEAPADLGKFDSVGIFEKSLPYWPMDIGLMEGAPRLDSHGTPSRPHFKRKAGDVLSADVRTLWWRSAQKLAELLEWSARPREAVWERARVDQARSQGMPVEELSKREKILAEAEARNAQINLGLGAMKAFATEVCAWSRAHPSWSHMSADDELFFKNAHARAKSEFKSFTAIVPDRRVELEVETLFEMLVGESEAFKHLPAQIVEWLPEAEHSQYALHHMFGPPMDTQAAYLREAKLKDMRLLFQLATDDMLALDLGETGAFQFYISPNDLVARNWSAVLGVRGMI